jgi:hypothetical protein
VNHWLLDDSQFIKSLTFPKLKDEYTKAKELLLSKIDEKYKKLHDNMVNEKNQGIEEDKTHRMVLNACIFPFAQEDSLEKYGYYFLYASPLQELEVPNVDFVLFHPNPVIRAIMGEVKGRVSDPHRVV